MIWFGGAGVEKRCAKDCRREMRKDEVWDPRAGAGGGGKRGAESLVENSSHSFHGDPTPAPLAVACSDANDDDDIIRRRASVIC